MVNKTAIEWTDYSPNPIKFRRKSDGKVVHGLREGLGRLQELLRRDHLYMAGLEPFVDESELRQLLSTRKLPAGSKVFVGDMTDVFGEWVPFEFLDRLFAVFALRPDVVFQLLTKRPERMREYMNGAFPRIQAEAWRLKPPAPPRHWYHAPTGGISIPLRNVWLGTSVENQRWADVRIPELLATPAAVRFISAEPLLGPVDFTRCDLSTLPPHPYNPIIELNAFTGLVSGMDEYTFGRVGIDWIIVGGESGPGARPFDVAWARSVVAQCKAAGVACFVKQLGSRPVSLMEQDDDFPRRSWAQNQSLALKSRKGGDMAEWPEDLRVREMPR